MSNNSLNMSNLVPQPDSAQSPRSPLSLALRILVALVVSVVFVYLFATHLNFSELTAMLHRTSAGWLIAGAALLGLANFIRADRFRLLDVKQHGLSYWWVATQIYNFTTSTLPGGLGEIMTAYLLRRSAVLGWAGALRLLVISRVIDLATLLSMYVAAMWALGLAWTTPTGILSCSVSVALVLVSLVLLLPSTQALALAIVTFLAQRVPTLGRVQEAIHRLASAALGINGRTGTQAALWSIAMGLVSASSVSVLLNGFGANLSIVQSCAAFGLYVLLQLIPVQGLAGVGTQSARWTVALFIVGVGPQQAAAEGIALYVCIYGVTALWALGAGAYSGLVRLHPRRGDNPAQPAVHRPPMDMPVSMLAQAQEEYLFLDRED